MCSLEALQPASTHLRRLAVEQPDNPEIVRQNSIRICCRTVYPMLYYHTLIISTSGQQLWFIGMPLKTLHLHGREVESLTMESNSTLWASNTSTSKSSSTTMKKRYSKCHIHRSTSSCLTLSGCGIVSTHLGQTMSHTLTVQSALALARMVLTTLFQESPSTASQWLSSPPPPAATSNWGTCAKQQNNTVEDPSHRCY